MQKREKKDIKPKGRVDFIEPSGEYEPSINLKNAWLKTRKKAKSYGDLTLPGLFISHDYTVDRFLFFLAVVLELYGAFNIWLVVPKPWLLLLLFPVDFVLALAAHAFHGKWCLAKNRLLLAKYGISFSRAKSSDYEERNQRGKIRFYVIWQLFFYLFIACLAVFKIVSFFQYSQDVLFLKIFMGVVYAGIAYIHIFHTGYWWSEYRFRKGVNKERMLQQDTGVNEEGKKLLTEYTIDRPRPYPLPDYEFHNIEVDNNKIISENRKRTLLSWGILQDNTLDQLVSPQASKPLQQELALSLLYHQIELLNSTVYRATESQKITSFDEAKKITKEQANISQ
jgi:hypothetical protein